VSSVAASPDGALIASGGDDGSVRVWSAKTGDLLLTWRGILRKDAGYALAPDGRVEVFGDARGALLCRIGQHTFPFELCAERLESPGLVARTLTQAAEPER
jgi:hypothetical protein